MKKHTQSQQQEGTESNVAGAYANTSIHTLSCSLPDNIDALHNLSLFCKCTIAVAEFEPPECWRLLNLAFGGQRLGSFSHRCAIRDAFQGVYLQAVRRLLRGWQHSSVPCTGAASSRQPLRGLPLSKGSHGDGSAPADSPRRCPIPQA